MFYLGVINTRRVAVNLEALSISPVPNQALGVGFDLLVEGIDGNLAILRILSGLPGVETEEVATAVERDLLDHFSKNDPVLIRVSCPSSPRNCKRKT